MSGRRRALASACRADRLAYRRQSAVSCHPGRQREGVTVASPVRPPTRRVRLDSFVVVSNVVSGALWLLFPAAIGAWPLSVIGAIYVFAASLFLAAVYGREALTVRREGLAWVAPWLGAVALWATVIGAMEFENTGLHYLAGLSIGLVLGTLCYLGWQILAIRQLAWRSKASSRSA